MFITPVFAIFEELEGRQELIDAYLELRDIIIEYDGVEIQDYIEWPIELESNQVDLLTDDLYDKYEEITDIIYDKVEEFGTELDLDFILIQNF